jgi:cellulose synthase/poly-beta-1,6-N-acetylglucosamine synthase-like glycosyltransferase
MLLSITMNIAEIVTYTVIFLALYVQIFLFITFLEHRKDLKKRSEERANPNSYPSVAVVVPCWNEEATIHGTIESLLQLDYPADKLQIIAVDDGSTDSTWTEMQKYVDNPRVKIFHKENGGKHTAVNYGIENTNTDFITCLDADSFVDKDALKNIIYMFEQDPSAMAVTPSVIIFQPKTFWQKIQKYDYIMGAYIKKMLSYLGAIHVTPGPFSVFKREVFTKLGGFRKAHNTEDMEIAFRMQENRMKIVNCHTALVNTVAPDTLYKLYRQRVRWIYGFIQNTFDYRRLIFRKAYGNFSLFTVPSGIVSITATVFIFFSVAYNVVVWLVENLTIWIAFGFDALQIGAKDDWFYINISAILFVTLILYAIIIFGITKGGRMTKQRIGVHILSYMFIYSLVAPFWLMKSVWNSISARKPSWR